VGQMGDFSKNELTMYSGITYAVTFFVVAVVSPLWGKLADRRGRKIMLLRSSLGMAFVIGAMGFVHNIWILILLRFLQGLCAGYIPNASALIAT
ncbi:MFS transporter, partial [Klebsiella pneumoniae]|nr:MFS transporter [Klebsiella pneumoniae]